jgi:hypothetical protein
VSLPGKEDFENDLLTAMERDLRSLQEESAETLDLGSDQATEMAGFLSEAWFVGTRTAVVQMRARAEARRHDIPPVPIDRIEAEFKALMDRSAEILNLTASLTICMWNFLGEAWVVGTQTCEAELMALFIERKSDISEEARRWLEGEDERAT